MNETTRCAWCSADPLYIRYHDDEWGQPLRDERALFELLCLEGQQAGLSWITVLKKREHYRLRFHGFVPERVASMSDDELEMVLQDPGVVRNRLKIYGIRKNAQAWLRLSQAQRDAGAFLWSFADHSKRRPRPATLADVPVTTPASDAMSKALKKAGFTFVGSTICYAFMQASGMVDDHTVDCWRAAHTDAAGAHALREAVE